MRFSSLFLVLAVLLCGCGQATQPPQSAQDAQATISALQTQVAMQSSPTQASSQASTSTPTSPPIPPPSVPSTDGAQPQGFITNRGSDGTSGVYFIQWAEVDGQITGALKYIHHPYDNAPETRAGVWLVMGTRNGATMNLSIQNLFDEWKDYTGTIEGNTFTLHASNPDPGESSSWAFRAATVQEYYSAAVPFYSLGIDSTALLTSDLHAYIASVDEQGNSGVYFIQWAEVNNQFIGDFTFVRDPSSDPNLDTVGAEPLLVRGSRNGSTLYFSIKDGPSGWEDFTGTIAGDTLTFQAPNAWVLRSATAQDYYTAIASLGGWGDVSEAAPASNGDGTAAFTANIDARQGWQSTDFFVEKDTKLMLQVIDGQWTHWKGYAPYNFGEGDTSYICGSSICVEPLPDFPKGALIGRIGDHIFGVGEQSSIEAQQSGILSLRINDADNEALYDNDGSLTVKISVEQ